MIPVLILVTLITFSLVHLTPGDPAIMRAGEDATAEQVESIRESMGLNRPVHMQYLNWIGGLFRGDLGYSLQDGRPVFITLIRRLPATIQLVIASFIVSIGIGIPIGILSAVKQNTFADSFARIFALLGLSMPNFWIGLMLMLLLSYRLRLLPASGSGSMLHLIMPAIALGFTCGRSYYKVNQVQHVRSSQRRLYQNCPVKGIKKSDCYL